jgi:hypothetical protein
MLLRSSDLVELACPTTCLTTGGGILLWWRAPGPRLRGFALTAPLWRATFSPRHTLAIGYLVSVQQRSTRRGAQTLHAVREWWQGQARRGPARPRTLARAPAVGSASSRQPAAQTETRANAPEAPALTLKPPPGRIQLVVPALLSWETSAMMRGHDDVGRGGRRGLFAGAAG